MPAWRNNRSGGTSSQRVSRNVSAALTTACRTASSRRPATAPAIHLLHPAHIGRASMV
jgi:hypothetical protein